MQIQEKTQKKNRAFVKGMRFAAALAFCLVFLCACAAVQPAVIPAATATESKMAAPGSSGTVRPSFEAEETTPKETAAAYIETAVCIADEYVNIRDRAGTDGRIIGTFPAGETAGVISYADGWANIAYNDLTGYASMDYLVFERVPGIPVPEGGWTQILVNTWSSLPADFSVELAGFEGGQVDVRILDVCEAMFADARKDGVELKLVDAYRSRGLQSELFEKKVQSYIAKGYGREDAETQAATITARPDTSEHQTGLALDIVTPAYTSRDSGFARTRAFEWLWANAGNYGFIMRYPENKTAYTGVIYEPWHWRFVGTAAAAEMKETGQCMEEYIGAEN